MFTVRTISKPLSIKTFELDIRTDIAISDLAIEVYTVMNGYTDVFNVESGRKHRGHSRTGQYLQ